MSSQPPEAGPGKGPGGADAPRPQPPPPAPAGAPEAPPADTAGQLEEIRNLLLVRRSSELVDLVTFLKSRRSLAWSNFVMGLSRGIGFFLGFTLVGALIVALVGFFVDWTAQTFRSNYSTRSIVRQVMSKYEEVMDEVAQVQGEKARSSAATQPAASGAHRGAVFAGARDD